MTRREWMLAGLWLLVTAALAAVPGCYGHNCDGDTVFFGRNAGEGRLLDRDTWESSPVDGKWLDFPHQRAFDVDLHQLGDRAPDLILPYVSAQENPLAENGNFTIGAGNITEISAANRGHVTVHNGTCADYFLRLVVVAAPEPPAATGDAGATDAGP